MKKEEIQLWDFERILIGEAPIDFMVEVFLRTIIIFFILLIAMRLFGKRLNANNSILEMTVLILLGAIVAVPMQLPERGILPGIVILGSLVIFYRMLSTINSKNEKSEELTMGAASLLVKNGVVDMEALKNAAVSQEQLFSQLRGKEIIHLGQVKRVYLEACGMFNVFKADRVIPGLSIIPRGDENMMRNINLSNEYFVCTNCGNLEKSGEIPGRSCHRCGAYLWDRATINGVSIEKESISIKKEFA